MQQIHRFLQPVALVHESNAALTAYHPFITI